MCPIADEQIDRNRCLLMYDDEQVMDAVVALRDANGQDWWHLVVDLAGGGYAVARFSDLTNALNRSGRALLTEPLSTLVGSTLSVVEVIVEQDQADLEAIHQRAAETESQTAVILRGGEFRGVIPAGRTRAATFAAPAPATTVRGLFDVGLVQLAGQYAEIPKEGTLSRRRREAMLKKKAPPPREADQEQEDKGHD